MAMVREGDANGDAEVPPALLEKPAGVPEGSYKLVGWDIDTTGRRLIDEICQIAAYTPESSYCQYIMPHGSFNPSAQRRHKLRVVTVGRYRMLKDSRTHKVLKTKSEVSALNEFLDWLEKEKGSADSVILIYHEPRRINTTMLLEALTRYNLVERFEKLVSGFADGYALATDRCKSSVKSVSLRMLARVLLDADSAAAEGAAERARAAYNVLQHLSQSEQVEVGPAGEGAALTGDMVRTARAWTRPVSDELSALAGLKTMLQRQNTLRPIFVPLLRTARTERKHVTALRKHLVDAGLVYIQLQQAWQQDKLQGLTKELEPVRETASEEEFKELLEILDCHFDPEKEAKGAKPREPRNKKVAGRPEHEGDNGTNGTDSGASSPADSPVKHSTAVSGDSELKKKTEVN